MMVRNLYLGISKPHKKVKFIDPDDSISKWFIAFFKINKLNC